MQGTIGLARAHGHPPGGPSDMRNIDSDNDSNNILDLPCSSDNRLLITNGTDGDLREKIEKFPYLKAGESPTADLGQGMETHSSPVQSQDHVLHFPCSENDSLITKRTEQLGPAANYNRPETAGVGGSTGERKKQDVSKASQGVEGEGMLQATNENPLESNVEEKQMPSSQVAARPLRLPLPDTFAPFALGEEEAHRLKIDRPDSSEEVAGSSEGAKVQQDRDATWSGHVGTGTGPKGLAWQSDPNVNPLPPIKKKKANGASNDSNKSNGYNSDSNDHVRDAKTPEEGSKREGKRRTSFQSIALFEQLEKAMAEENKRQGFHPVKVRTGVDEGKGGDSMEGTLEFSGLVERTGSEKKWRVSLQNSSQYVEHLLSDLEAKDRLVKQREHQRIMLQKQLQQQRARQKAQGQARAAKNVSFFQVSDNNGERCLLPREDSSGGIIVDTASDDGASSIATDPIEFELLSQPGVESVLKTPGGGSKVKVLRNELASSSAAPSSSRPAGRRKRRGRGKHQFSSGGASRSARFGIHPASAVFGNPALLSSSTYHQVISGGFADTQCESCVVQDCVIA